MITKNKSQSCSRCRYYQAIYVRCISCFYKKNFGICGRSQIIVQPNEHCECYKCRQPMDKTVMPEHVDLAISDVYVLENMLYRFE